MNKLFNFFVFLQPFFDDGDDLSIGGDLDALEGDENDDNKEGDDEEKESSEDVDDNTGDGEDDKDEDTKDDENEEEDDKKDDKEKEDEEEDDTEELKTTSWTDIKKKYPEFGKEFPDVKASLFREQRYSEILGSPEDAVEAVEKAGILDAMSDDLINKGDPTALLEQILKTNKESFKKVALAIMPFLNEKDKDTYYAVAGVPIKQLLRAVHAEGKGKTTDLGRAALLIHHWYFDNYDVDKEIQGERKTEVTQSPREKALEEKLNQINTREEQAFSNSMDNSYITKMSAHILEGLSKDDRLNEYTKGKLVNDILADIKKQLSADTAYTGKMKSLYKQAKQGGFTNDFKSRLINTALVRAKSLVPTVRGKLVSQALGKKAVRPGEEKKKAASNGNNPPQRNTTTSSRHVERKSEKNVIKSDIDILRS